MTSVTFPFFVGLPTADKRIPLIDAEFRFTTRAVRAMERSAGCGIAYVLARGQSLEAVVLLVCYGLLWNDAQMTEDRACGLIEDFLDAGGVMTNLSDALFKALNESGIYGRKNPLEGTAPQTKATAPPADPPTASHAAAPDA